MIPHADQIGAVGVALLVALWLVLKYRPWEKPSQPTPMALKQEDEDSENGKSGKKPVSFWREEFRRAIKEGLEEYDKGRLDKFQIMIQQELNKAIDRLKDK